MANYSGKLSGAQIDALPDDLSELSQKVGDLDADVVHKTTIEDVEYDGAVDGQPVAELKTALAAEVSARQAADNNKQDTISDLSTIRSNASAGAALVGNVSYYTVLS